MSDRSDLEEERQFLLESLRDLDRERQAGEIDEADYQSLRDDYTSRAAEVLRALEAHGDRPDDRPVRGATRHSTSRRALALGLIAAFVLVAGASVFMVAADRQPGAPITGSLPETPAQKLALAHELEAQGEALEALKLYDSVLEEDPANVEALTYRGWLLKLAGLADEAQASFERAMAIDPRYPDVRFFYGMLLYQDRDDPAAAVVEFETFLASSPPPGTAEAVQGVLDRARSDADARSATTTTAP